MNNLVDSIEFRATSRKSALPGLDEALTKLRALGAELDAINGRLNGLSSMSSFKRTKAELADLLKQQKSKTTQIKSVAQVLGIPDVKDFEAFVSRWKAAH